jgi:RHS repeat-associated protein
MKLNVLQPWRRLRWFTAAKFWDGLCGFATMHRKRLRRLLARLVDLEAFEAKRRKKRSYWPEIQPLEARQVPTLSVTGTTFHPTASIGYTDANNIASFTDPGGMQPASAYTVLIAWGDGQPDSPGINDGSGNIAGDHTYLTAGTFTVGITVTGNGDSGSGNSTAIVSAAGTAGVVTPDNSPQQATVPLTSISSATLQTGTVITDVSLGGPDVPMCGCEDPGLGIVYNGAAVPGDPVDQVTVGTAAGGTPPASVTNVLNWNSGGNQATVTYNSTGLSGGDVLVMDVQSTTAVNASGAYSYSVQIATGGLPTTKSGTAYYAMSNNTDGDSAGVGWSIIGVNQLVSVSGGVIWKDGQGNGRFFAGSFMLGGGTYTNPKGEFGTLTKNMDGTVTYTSAGGLYTIYFASPSSGISYETRKVTADSQTTTFTHSGTELTGIATPDGRLVTLTYDGNGDLHTVQLPSGTATLTHDGSHNLTGIQRPDSSVLTFAYDGSSRMTVAKTPDTTTTFTYDGHGMLSQVDRGLSDITTFAPELSHGFGATAGALPANVAVVADALSRATTYMLDGDGQIIQELTPDGAAQQFTYDSNYHMRTAADGLNRLTVNKYSLLTGELLDSTTSPDGGTTSYGYDATLKEVTSIEDPLTNRTTITYTGSGDMSTYEDPSGGVTTYTWSGGLLQTKTDPDGHVTSYVYDGNNDLIAVIAPSGLRTTYGYDAAGRRTSVEQPDGSVTTTSYDAMGRVTGTVNPDGSQTTTTYDGDGNVVTTTDTHGNLTTHLYDAVGRETTVIDPLGNRSTTVYDAAGEVTARVDQFGNRTSFTYDGMGRVVGTEDHTGHWTTNVYDLAGQLTASVNEYGDRTSFTYDRAGRQTSVLDPFTNRTTSVYDADGHLIASVDQYGNRTSFSYDAAGRQIATEDQYGHTSTTVYDAAGNVTAQVDIYGNRTTTIYDSYGRFSAAEDQYSHYTTTSYDSYGRVSASIDIYGNATTTTYDAYGRVSSTVDALGNRVTYGYDAYGEQVSVQDSRGTTTTVYDSYGRVSATVDVLGNRTTTTYNGNGQVSATIDALNNRTTIIYDSYGRQSGIEDARSNITTTIYDAYGRVSATEDALTNYTTTIYDSHGRISASEDPDSNLSTTLYDSEGRVSAAVDPPGNHITTIYDSYGRVSATEDGRSNLTTTVYDSYGRVSATEDSLSHYTTTIYDSTGRVSATENQLGNYATTIYDSYGRFSASEDALNHYTTTVYDSYGRDVATIDALGNRTTMVLDSFGRQVNEVDADSNKTTFVYDGLNRVINETSPTSGLSTMTYDADGRLSTSTDALGREITYSYDAVGNNTGQTWLNADTTVQSRLTFTYDADNRLLTAANGAGTYTLTYNAVGEVATAKDPWGDLLTFTYDAAGHRTKVQDNFSGVTSNVYDANANLTQQQFGGSGQTPMRIDQSYNANNLLTDVTRYSDLAGTTKVATTSHVYDVAGELTSQIDKTGGGSNIANYTWVYDAAGRLTSETLNSGSPVTYTYDADNQLTGDTVATHTYDAEGNRTGTGYSTGTGNELQSDPGWNYSYDATGDETKKVAISGGQTWKYTYDDKNELTSAKLWSADPDTVGTAVLQKEVDYTYDAWGNMIARSDDPDGSGPTTPSLTHYALDGWNPSLTGATGTSNFNVWAELDGNNSNALLTRYFHGDQVDQLFGRQDAGVAYWYLTDRLGSVRDVLDNTGTTKDAISYDGFGNITSESNSTYRGNYAWTGRQFDVETSLQYNRARWYDPATGRWQSPQLDEFGDSNLYRYVHNTTPDTLDPSGLPEDGDSPDDGVPPIVSKYRREAADLIRDNPDDRTVENQRRRLQLFDPGYSEETLRDAVANDLMLADLQREEKRAAQAKANTAKMKRFDGIVIEPNPPPPPKSFNGVRLIPVGLTFVLFGGGSLTYAYAWDNNGDAAIVWMLSGRVGMEGAAAIGGIIEYPDISLDIFIRTQSQQCQDISGAIGPLPLGGTKGRVGDSNGGGITIGPGVGASVGVGSGTNVIWRKGKD